VLEALGWGVVAASSLVLGAWLGIVRSWPNRIIGSVLGFGAGALISAVSFDLAEDGVRLGGADSVALGLAAGALTYFVADRFLDRPRRTAPAPDGRTTENGTADDDAADDDAGSALALGAFLDGIPEQMVLGIGLVSGNGVSLGLLAAIFVSNLPEAIGSATEMFAAGRKPGVILRLWLAVAAVCALATVVGFAVADNVSNDWQATINGFAAGALLVMLIDSMIPEATRKAGRVTGLVTVLGFAVAAGLSGIS
jgi:zinc transporter, ZIP family